MVRESKETSHTRNVTLMGRNCRTVDTRNTFEHGKRRLSSDTLTAEGILRYSLTVNSDRFHVFWIPAGQSSTLFPLTTTVPPEPPPFTVMLCENNISDTSVLDATPPAAFR